MDNLLSKIKKPRKSKEDIQFVLLDNTENQINNNENNNNENNKLTKEKKVITNSKKHIIKPNIDFVILNEPQINSDKVVLHLWTFKTPIFI